MRRELERQGFESGRVHVERMLNMRFEGTDTALMVLPNSGDGDGAEDFEAAFKRVYKSEFGFLLETKSIIVDDIKVYIYLAWARSSDILPTDAYVYRSVGSARRSTAWGSRCMPR